MKRTKNINTNKAYNKAHTKDPLHTLRELSLVRSVWAGLLGYQYGTSRDIYEALGYDKTLYYEDYRKRYARQDIAYACIHRPVERTWDDTFRIVEVDDDKDTQFEKSANDLVKDMKLQSIFQRLDILTGLGEYGVLVMGLSDVKTPQDMKNPVQGTNLKLIYLQPYSQDSAKVNEWETDPTSPRFGMPKTYTITMANAATGDQKEMVVHYTRILHVTDGNLESEIAGTPRLQMVYNRLMDLEKITGGSAEMFWRGARGGYHGKVNKDFQKTTELEDDLQDQLDEYEHNLRRFLVTEGMDIEQLAQQVSDPKNHIDVQLTMISVALRIPKRILMGTERGELSSAQDQDEFSSYVEGRREKFADEKIIVPFFDMMIKYGVIQKPQTEDYSVVWPDLFAKGEQQKAEVGLIRAKALKEYASQPRAEEIIPMQAFMELFLGLDEDQVTQVQEMIKAMQGEETTEKVTAEEEDMMQQEPQNNIGSTLIANHCHNRKLIKTHNV